VLQLQLIDTTSGARRAVALSDQPLLIGGGVDCDLVLPGPGVAAHQCRIEPASDGLRVVDLGSDHDTLLNGKAIGRALIHVGDVLRLGAFQITLVPAKAPAPQAAPAARAAPGAPAPAAARAAAPASALPEPPRPRAPVRAGARRGDEGRGPVRKRPASGSPAAVFGALVLVGLVIGGFMFFGGGGDGGEDAATKALRVKLDEARQLSDACRFDDSLRTVSDVLGSGDTPLRPDALELETQVKSRKERYARGMAELAELRTRVARDMKGNTAGAVKRFRDAYADLPPLCDQVIALEDDLQARLSKPAVPVDLEGITLPENRTVADCVREGEKWSAKGEFGKAIYVLKSVEAKDDAERKSQADAVAKVNVDARKIGDEILRRVKEHLELGHVLQALGEFDDENLRPLKYTDVWYDLLEKADEVEDAVDAKIPESSRPVQRRKHARPRPEAAPAGDKEKEKKASKATSEPWRPLVPMPPRPADQEPEPVAKAPSPGGEPATPSGAAPSGAAAALDEQARACLSRGEFARAKALLELALDEGAPPEEKSRIARDHERAARPLALAARIVELLAARPLQGAPFVKLLDGRHGKLVRSDGTALWIDFSGEETSVAAAELDPRSLLDLTGRLPLSNEESLDRAFLALAGGDEKAFFASLEKAAADGALQGSIDSALAFQRGLDRVPGRGFVRVGERWLTWEEKATEELAREIREAIAAALAPQADAAKGRAQVVELAGVAPALTIEQLERTRAELGRSFAAVPEQEKLAKLRGKALELQAARKSALDLIFDEAKYFYPYSPPACPPEKAAQYAEVQQEVDRLVGAVRAIGGREEDEPADPHVALSPALVDVVRQLKLVRALLFELGAPRDELDGALCAAWCLPEGAHSVNLRNFALDEHERARLDQDARILVLNATAAPQDEGPSREELEQVLVTNRYRALLGRCVLAYNSKLWSAARGHSDWMARVGQLSHFEDDPVRASPEQRMKLAGYDHGAGENCAAGRMGAREVLDGWCHSSGHHRNLLYESHTELGAGQSGSFWTQCFGGGREYKGNLIRD